MTFGSIPFAVAILSGLASATPGFATTWMIDMDEVVCRCDAIVVGVMDKPIEIEREPYRPHRDGTPTEKVKAISRLTVSEVLWGIPSLREIDLVSGRVEPPEYILPQALRSPPGSSRPVDTEDPAAARIETVLSSGIQGTDPNGRVWVRRQGAAHIGDHWNDGLDLADSPVIEVCVIASGTGSGTGTGSMWAREFAPRTPSDLTLTPESTWDITPRPGVPR